ncbi:MAG: RHS repeat-associated core domain-containing protein [Anaerolineales bacterium]|nr:RHS repeat-associated core domain-containing protein [Anaerolineales bacterium]
MRKTYGYTGEWYEGYMNLLHLRARWYSPGEGVFLSRDPVESEPPYQYVRGNPINWTDPSGLLPNYVIARELGFNNFDDVMAAARGQWGLLKALQDAKNGDKIYYYQGLLPPSEANYRGDTAVPGLQGDWGRAATILCLDGKLRIQWSGLPVNSGQRIVDKSPFAHSAGGYWAYSINKQPIRGDSQRIAYTNLNTSGRRSYDFVGIQDQFSPTFLKILSGGGTYIVDRYGRRYIGYGISFGLGLSPADVRFFGGLHSGNWDNSRNTVLFGQGHSIPDPIQLQNFIIGWSLGSSVSPIVGGSAFGNASGLGASISAGTNIGFSVLDYGINTWAIDDLPREEYAWNWADKIPGFDASNIIKDDKKSPNVCLECTGGYFHNPINIPPVPPPSVK